MTPAGLAESTLGRDNRVCASISRRKAGTEIAGIRLDIRTDVRAASVAENANLGCQVIHFHAPLGVHRATEGQRTRLRVRSADGEPTVAGEVHADERHFPAEAFDEERGQLLRICAAAKLFTTVKGEVAAVGQAKELRGASLEPGVADQQVAAVADVVGAKIAAGGPAEPHDGTAVHVDRGMLGIAAARLRAAQFDAGLLQAAHQQAIDASKRPELLGKDASAGLVYAFHANGLHVGNGCHVEVAERGVAWTENAQAPDQYLAPSR